MKKSLKSIALSLALIMLCSALFSCDISHTEDESKSGSVDQTTSENSREDTSENNETDGITNTTTERQEVEYTTEAETAETGEEDTEIVLEGEHSELILLSNTLANGVQAYFSDCDWSAFTVKNQNIQFEYPISYKSKQQISYLANSNGINYIENTMDVFVTTLDGITYYASNSTEDAVINVTKFGYYYDEIRAEYQNFLSDGENRQAAKDLSLARIFHTYSDKLHTEAQIAASNTVENIASIGFKTEIDADRVEKLIVKDASGHKYAIEDVDWATAEYIGFDVKDAGIFGYILPFDAVDYLSVTLEDGKYVIIQSRAPADNKILPGSGNPYKKEGVAGNNNDFYIGQRIYTDETHTFDLFLNEAYLERNPLGTDSIKVIAEKSDEGAFEGYDSLRGSYIFSIDGNTEGRDQYSFFPNRKFNINFTLDGDGYDRQIYAVVYTNKVSHSDFGSLECAVLLDSDKLLLPVPIEVGKNFGADMDVNIFDLIDIAYGEAILPLKLSSDGHLEYNLVHIYQNWGNFPLKQLSYIEYHSPYYHLSTGLTETNCIVPWKFTSERAISNLLPDHRGMSAPLWTNGPQHTQSGTHNFLEYTDVKHNTHIGEIYNQTIDSYGPTYAEVTMDHLSSDGKIKISYTHIEMPQLDENRTYYVFEYEFLEDITIKYFNKNFIFYSVGSTEWPTLYQRFSFLDENNTLQLKVFDEEPSEQLYVLGSECPYFASFKLRHNNYANVALLVHSSEVIIGGERQDVALALRRSGQRLGLTLNLGNVMFQKGDKITINAIILPWGSQKTDFSGEKYAPDQNVRDVRENSLINDMKLTAGENTEIIESVFVPKARTLDGKTAEFTISGGAVSEYNIPYRNDGYNVAIRAYGFDKLSAPVIYELVDGEWIRYEICSASNPDFGGYGDEYDGYSVYYDGDGTYSYSFVVNMDSATPRTFKVVLE